MADDFNPPEAALKQVLSSYPYLTETNPSSWCVWSDSPYLPPLFKLQQVCHADMRWHKIGYDHLVTAFPKTDKLSLKYIRMLISGPFRAFSDTISLKKLKDQYFLQVDQLDKWPANVLFNFCIASRGPIEFEHLLKYWNQLIWDGYPDVLAFLLSYSTDGQAFKKERKFPQNNHFFIDPASNWRHVLNGTPNMDVKSYKEGPHGITPSNSIWGVSADWYKVSSLSNDKVAEYFDIKQIKKPVKVEQKLNDQVAKGAALYKQIMAQQAQGIDIQAIPNNLIFNNPMLGAAPPQPLHAQDNAVNHPWVNHIAGVPQWNEQPPQPQPVLEDDAHIAFDDEQEDWPAFEDQGDD